ncbi:MAG: hypothetical protein HQL56_05270 [Magnetococcales bacterium]|nr:hypothetical protein [Magnetococcales bacterium]
MRHLLLLAWMFLGSWLGGLVPAVAAEAEPDRPPVAMLMQLSGDVQFSKDGDKWKPLDRNKFVYPGNQVKTGANGSLKVLLQANNTLQEMGANAHIQIEEAAVKVMAGSLSAPAAASGDLMAGFSNRFAQAQRYTTLRRSAKQEGEVKLKVARSVALSKEFPELAWENVGEEFSYQLILDGKTLPVPSTKDPVVRVRIDNASPGEHEFDVKVMKGSEVVFEAKRGGSLVWMSNEEMEAVKSGLSRIKQVAGEDDLMVAGYLEERGLAVAAMDHYQAHFRKHPQDNDMRPLLIQAYNTLKLENMKREEAQRYNKMLVEKQD